MKLNLGCGQNKIENTINIDISNYFDPDKCFPLDNINIQWDIESNSIEEVYAFHIIEHLGKSTEDYFHFIKELYRVCKDGAIIHIIVPHPKNDNFLHDATHVRPITEHHFLLFSKERNKQQQIWNGHESQLGLQLDVDFEILDTKFKFESDINEQLNSGQITIEQVQSMVRFNNNIVSEIHQTLIVKKDN